MYSQAANDAFTGDDVGIFDIDTTGLLGNLTFANQVGGDVYGFSLAAVTNFIKAHPVVALLTVGIVLWYYSK